MSLVGSEELQNIKSQVCIGHYTQSGTLQRLQYLSASLLDPAIFVLLFKKKGFTNGN